MRRATALVLALLAVLVSPAGGTVGASSAGDPATSLMTQINRERTARGLVPFAVDSRLWAIAKGRATRLATYEVLSHSAAGSIPDDLATHEVRWSGYGEVIGYASGSPGDAGPTILQMWLASPDHWPLLLSARYNYVGVGIAYRASSGLSYASVVLTESPDRTGAGASVTGALVFGNAIRWSWRGSDPPLQTHTAGLRDFTLQLRTDHGPWVTIARAVTATARTTPNLAHGHWYGLRVRASDRVGNVGPWSRERRVWLP